jgi:hypothetical protein
LKHADFIYENLIKYGPLLPLPSATHTPLYVQLEERLDLKAADEFYAGLDEQQKEKLKNEFSNFFKGLVGENAHNMVDIMLSEDDRYSSLRDPKKNKENLFWPFAAYTISSLSNLEEKQKDQFIQDRMSEILGCRELCSHGQIELVKMLTGDLYLLHENELLKPDNRLLTEEIPPQDGKLVQEVINQSFTIAVNKITADFVQRKITSAGGMAVHYGNALEDLKKYWGTGDTEMRLSSADRLRGNFIPDLIEFLNDRRTLIPLKKLMWDRLQTDLDVLSRISELPEFQNYRNSLSEGVEGFENSFEKIIALHWDLSDDGSFSSGLCLQKHAAELLYLAKAFPKTLPKLDAPNKES